MVFFQNGMLEPWFQSKGLGDADQVLAYFAVSKLGEAPIDGITDTNPEGLTAAFGKWASAVAARLHSGGLSCKVRLWEWWTSLTTLWNSYLYWAYQIFLSYDLIQDPLLVFLFMSINSNQHSCLCCNVHLQVLDREAFEKQMVEKLIWISAFMLVGARHPGATVGVVEKDYRSEARLIHSVSTFKNWTGCQTDWLDG